MLSVNGKGRTPLKAPNQAGDEGLGRVLGRDDEAIGAVAKQGLSLSLPLSFSLSGFALGVGFRCCRLARCSLLGFNLCILSCSLGVFDGGDVGEESNGECVDSVLDFFGEVEVANSTSVDSTLF